MACCSMRTKTPRYKVFDGQGRFVKTSKSESNARNLAVALRGHYQAEWVAS